MDSEHPNTERFEGEETTELGATVEELLNTDEES